MDNAHFFAFSFDNLGLWNEYVLLGNSLIRIGCIATNLSYYRVFSFTANLDNFFTCAHCIFLSRYLVVKLFVPVGGFQTKMGFPKKKSSDGVDKVKDFWNVKGLVSRLKKKNSEVDGLMVIGIDFGTTYAFYYLECSSRTFL